MINPLSFYKPVILKAPKCFKTYPPKVKSRITTADMKQSICFKSTKQQHNRERRKELILQRRHAKQLLKSEFGRFEYLTFQSSTIRSLKTENGEDPTFMFHAKIRESQQSPPPMILTMVLSPRQKGLCESQPGQSDPGKALQLLQSRIIGPSDPIPICPTNKH